MIQKCIYCKIEKIETYNPPLNLFLFGNKILCTNHIIPFLNPVCNKCFDFMQEEHLNIFICQNDSISTINMSYMTWLKDVKKVV